MANTTGNKFGGRKPGTPNKITKDIRESFQHLIEDNLPILQNDIDSLTSKERIDVLLSMANFIIPKMRSIEDTTQDTTKEDDDLSKYTTDELIKRAEAIRKITNN